MEIVFFLCTTLLLFTYLGFDICIFLLAKIFPKKIAKNSIFEPNITVIIPVKNEEFTIQKKLENLLQTEYPLEKIQILVIDSESTDRTKELVGFFGEKVQIVEVPHHGKAAAMIIAINQYATGDIIISTDANAYFKPDTIGRVVQNFHDATVGGVTGCMMQEDTSGTSASQNSSLYWKIETFRRVYESGFHSCISMSGELSCFRRNIVKGQNWYTKGDPDDFDLTLFIIQKGYRVVYEKEAYVWEQAPDSLSDIEKQKVRIIVQTISSLIHHPKMLYFGKYGFILFSHKFLPLISPFLLIGLLVSNIWLLNNGVIFKIIFLIQAIVYGGYFFRLQFSVFKITHYFLFLNFLVLKGWGKYLQGSDFTKWDKIMSSRK